MSSHALLPLVVTVVVSVLVGSFVRIAGRALLVIVAVVVLGGGGMVAAIAGNAFGDLTAGLADSVRDRLAGVPALGTLFDRDPRASRDRVVRVIDGDTVELEHAGRARLIGVDTPETVKSGHPVQCGGPQASAFTKQLLSGKRVTVRYDDERTDDYGRALVYLFTPDGRMANATVVRAGHARTLRIEPNTRHAERFAALQADAKRHRRGLWGHC